MKKKTDLFQQAMMSQIKVRAHKFGIAELSKKTGLSRETLYRTVSERGNPRLTTLIKITEALGLEFDVYLARSKAAK